MFRTTIDRVRRRGERPVDNTPDDGLPALELQVQTGNRAMFVGESPPVSPIDPFEFSGINMRLSQIIPENHAEGSSSGKKPQLPVKSTNDSVIEPDVEFLRGIGREAQVWTTYVKETKEFDDDMVDGWNKFVLESAKQLEPDKADQTVEILREISWVLQSRGAQAPLAVRSNTSADAEFRPTRNAVWINCLWFLSLSLSVAVSLAAMLAKQWCYYYLSGRSGDSITQAEERQKRYGGLAKWRMQGVLEHLPMLMHIALGRLARWLSPPKDESSGSNATELETRVHWMAKLKTWAVWQRLLRPFRAIKNWISDFISVTETTATSQPLAHPGPNLPTNEHPHTVISIPATLNIPQDIALSPSSPSLADSDEEAEPFVKDALEWLIFNSQKSASIDTAIGALAIGKVKFENEDMKRRVNLHLVKHFPDSFMPVQTGHRLELSTQPHALKQALDYVNWMSYFAGSDHSAVTQQLRQFDKSFGTELVTRLGLALASLADQKTLSADAGKNVAFWLSSFVKCYDEESIFLTEDILSILIDGLTIAGRNVSSVRVQDRAQILSIPQLISILWKVSHVDKSVLRSSIALNLAVFALTTNIPYSINKRNFKSTADHLAYNYRSPVDRNASFTSFAVFALLGFVHPKSKLHLDVKTLDISTQIIYETKYLAPATLAIDLPGIVEYYPLRRRLTSMLIESMIQSPMSPAMSWRYLVRTAYRRLGTARQWIDQPKFESTIHAIRYLVADHLNERAVLHDDAIVAATDLLYREVRKLKGLDVTIIGFSATNQIQNSPPSRSMNPAEETIPMAEDSPERTASATLALIMKRSDNKQCLETAVRTVLFHTNRCNVELVMQATRWFSLTFGAPEFSEENINENQLLHICGYARILVSMVLHCTDPDGLAQSLQIGDKTSVGTAEYIFVRDKLQLLSTKAQDRHVHAFAIAGIAAWKFACPNQTYRAEVTQDTLQNVWDLIIKHTDHSRGAEPSERAMGQQVHENILRPEAIEALVDTTVLFTAVTDSTVKLNSLQARALLRLADQFRPGTKQPVRLAPVRIALAIALAFWGLSLDLNPWEFWTLDDRKTWWRDYLHPKKRESDVAALFLLGISRVLAHYEQLMLNHASIKTISLEIDRYMQQHADHPDTLTLPFLTGFDVRRHVRESVRDYLQGTESDGPFTHSTTMSRERLRSALQYDGGEGFRYEVPHPLSPRVSERQVSFSEDPVYDTQAAQAPEAP
ncbi:hypothetical protein FRC09_020200 [Ceratobasidium sp. 395]|nr:hypothetical protein FRC09_020200 [Ceratobasidium sp. 395]